MIEQLTTRVLTRIPTRTLRKRMRNTTMSKEHVWDEDEDKEDDNEYEGD